MHTYSVVLHWCRAFRVAGTVSRVAINAKRRGQGANIRGWLAGTAYCFYMHTRRSCCSGPWQHVSSSTTSLLRWRRCSGPAIRWPGSATAHCFGWDVGAKVPRRPEVSTCAATPFPSFCWFESQDCQPVRGPSFFLVGWVSAPITGERQGRCMWSVRHRVHCHKSLGTCKHCCGTVYTVRHDCRDAHWPKNKNNTKVAARELRSVAERTKQGYPWFS